VFACVALLSLVPAEARGESVIVALGDSLTAGWGLAADEAAWITGSTLTINGGQFMD